MMTCQVNQPTTLSSGSSVRQVVPIGVVVLARHDEGIDALRTFQVEVDALRLQIAAHPNPELRAKLEEAGVQVSVDMLA